MTAPNWLEGLLTMVRNALRSPGRSETTNAESALAQTRAQLAAFRQEKSQEQAALAAMTIQALDGEVSAGELESQRSALDKVQARIEQLEGVESALVQRLSDAKQRADTIEIARRWAKLREHVAAITEGMKKISAGIALILAGIKQVREANAEAKAIAPAKPVTWPMLWDFPHHLSAAIQVELVRGDSVSFRFLPQSVVYGQATLEDKHRFAVSEVLPPEPEQKAA